MKNFIVTSKVIRRTHQRSIDSKGILKQSESEEAPNRPDASSRNTRQLVKNYFYTNVK